MSIFKKTLASLGIGSAKVDSILQQEAIVPGEVVRIIIHVYGGSTEQYIDHIDLKLCCKYVAVREVNHAEDEQRNRKKRVTEHYELAKWQLPYAFTIHPGEERTFEVELDVPYNTPVTIGDSKVWLDTALDIDMALDPTDKDMITVRPDTVMDRIFSELEELGLRIRQVECEEAEGFAMPFVQEFEFVPTSGPFHGIWREVEIIAYRDESGLQLWFEIDRQQKGLGGLLSSLLGTSELHHHLHFSNDLPAEQVAQTVIDYLSDLFESQRD